MKPGFIIRRYVTFSWSRFAFGVDYHRPLSDSGHLVYLYFGPLLVCLFEHNEGWDETG